MQFFELPIALQVELTDGLSWPSISFAILIGALLLSAYILMRRYQSRRQLLRRVDELEALSAAGRAIVAAELDMMALCALIADESGKVIDTNTFQIGTFEDHLYRILYWRINGQNQETPRVFDLNENPGVVGWVRDSRQPLLVYDFQREMDQLPARPRYISATPPRSAIFIPLISGEETIGILAAQHEQPNRFDEEDLRRLMILANQAAAAIAHAQLFAEERKRAAHLQLVGQIARQLNNVQELEEIFAQVVQLTQETFGFHPVSIFLIDQEAGGLVLQASSDEQLSAAGILLPVGQGLIGRAVAEQQTVIGNNIGEDGRFISQIDAFPFSHVPETRAEMAVPLLVNGEVLGVLDVQSPSLGVFAMADKSTLEALAAEVAIAIEKARQLNRQQIQAWITTAQLQIAEAIGRAGDLDELTTVVARLTSLLAGTPLCGLLVWDNDYELYRPASFYAEHAGNFQPQVTLSIGDWPALDAVHVGQQMMTTTQAPAWLVKCLPERPSQLTLIPMRAASRAVGILLVQPDENAPAATQHQWEELLSNVASQAAQAVESAQLRTAQQEEAWVNTALLQVAEAVNSLIDLNEILNTIVRLVPLLVGVKSTLILIWDESRQLFYPGPSYGVSAMGRGLLETLQVDRDEVNALAAQVAGAFSPTSAYYSLKLPDWLRKAMGSNYAHAFPLNARGRLVGILIVGEPPAHGRSFSPRRMNILNGIAHQAATAVVNNQLYKESAERSRLEQELSVAHEIQASLIPHGSPEIPGCTVASFWQAARQVSGDFYDFLALPDGRWGIVIADVADKGVPAALFMALSRTVLRTVAFNRDDPAQVLMRTNRIIDSDTQTDLFVTVFYAVWDPAKQVLVYANGGHNPPLLLQKKGNPQLLKGSGIALGVLPDVTIDQHAIRLRPGDTLIFYTDGVTEAMNEDYDEFGLHRLRVVAENNRKRSAQEIVQEITRAVHMHAGDTAQSDDLTLVVLKRE